MRFKLAAFLILVLVILVTYKSCSRKVLEDRREYHGETPMSLEKKTEVTKKILTAKKKIGQGKIFDEKEDLRKTLKEQLKKLMAQVQEDGELCKKAMEEMMPGNVALDIESILYQNPKNVHEFTSRVLKTLYSKNAQKTYLIFKQLIEEGDQIHPDKFYEEVDRLYVCREEKTFSFLSGVVQASIENNFPSKEFVQKSFLMQALNMVNLPSWNDNANVALSLFSMVFEEELEEDDQNELNRIREELNRVEVDSRKVMATEESPESGLIGLKDYFRESDNIREEVRTFLQNYLDANEI